MKKVNIRALRERANPKISQTELAKKIGKDQAQISRWEEDPGSIQYDDMIKIFVALGVDPAHVFTELGDEESKGINVGNAHSELQRKLSLLKEFADSGKTGLEDLPDGSPTLEDLLNLVELLGRKPNLAAYGPFDSGKSTILNSILGANYLPTNYQPATKTPTYVRHLDDRPTWMKEQTWMMGNGFDPLKWDDEGHCKENRIVAGGIEALREFGTHDGSGLTDEEPCYALVYADAPLLRGCNIIDLPGFGGEDNDENRAESNPVIADMAIFASHHAGFLNGPELVQLGSIIRNLPAFERYQEGFPQLGNLYILATHAGPQIQKLNLEEILNTASKRAWRHLEAILVERAQGSGRKFEEENLQSRFFSFYAQSPDRRVAFENDLKTTVGTHLPLVWDLRATKEIRVFKKTSKSKLSRIITSYQKMAKDIDQANEQFKQAEVNEPKRRKRMAADRKNILVNINKYNAATNDHLNQLYSKTMNTERIEALIESRFPKKKDAKQNLGAFLIEEIQNGVEKKTTKYANMLSTEVDDYLKGYDEAEILMNEGGLSVGIPFNAKGVFLGSLLGMAGVGALAFWAASLGNLGAYIIAAKTVSLLSALGISIAGGTATVASFLAAIGGPVTVAVAIVALFALLGFTLFGSSWKKRLAKKIIAVFAKKKIQGSFEKAISDYWEQTEDSFLKSATTVEEKFREYFEDLRELVMDKEAGREELDRRLHRLEKARDFFGGIPWKDTQ